MEGEIPMTDADGFLDLPAIRREFRGMGFANHFGDAGRAACARFPCLDLNPAKGGGLLKLPFINMKRAGEVADGQSSGAPVQNALNAGETFATKLSLYIGHSFRSMNLLMHRLIITFFVFVHITAFSAEQNREFIHFKVREPENGSQEVMLRISSIQMVKKSGDTIECYTSTHIITTKFKDYANGISGLNVAFHVINKIVERSPFKAPDREDYNMSSSKEWREYQEAQLFGSMNHNELFPDQMTVRLIDQKP
jgi:hypothetical protein